MSGRDTAGAVSPPSGGRSLIAGILEARARSTPDAVALSEYDGDSLTFAAWRQRSDCVARGLIASGVLPGDRVVLLLDIGRWIEFAISYIAVLKAGSTVVTVSGHWTATDVRRVLDDVGPDLIVAAAPVEGVSIETVAPNDLEARGGAAPISHQPVARTAELQCRGGALHTPLLRQWSERDLVSLAGIARDGDQAGPWDDLWPRSPARLLHAFAPGSRAAAAALLASLGPGRGAVVSARSTAPLGCVDPRSFTAAIAAIRPTILGLPGSAAQALLAMGVLRSSALTSVQSVLIEADSTAEILERVSAALPGVTVSAIGDGRELRAAGRPVVTRDMAPTSAHAERTAPELFPALTSQVGMVWHEQLTPGSFNLSPLVRRYIGDLDVAAMEAALSHLVARHAALRTSFRIVDGELMQAVSAAVPIKLPIIDLDAHTLESIEAELARRVRDARSGPFDLARGPLFAPSLLRLGPRDHVMIIRVHHTVFDDWSVGTFRDELSTLYRAFRSGEPSPLPPLRASYADVCRRKLGVLKGASGATDLAFWRRELAAAPAALELDIGDPETPRGAPMPAAAPVRIELPSDLAHGLTDLARRQRATVFMVMLAALAVVVSRATAQEDLVMSMLAADRDSPDEASLIGCFAKKVILHISLAGDPAFATLVERARQSVLASVSHKTPSFETVVQDCLNPVAAVHGISARVSVKFQSAAAASTPLHLPGLEVRAVAAAAPIPAPHFQARRGGDAPPDAAGIWGAGVYAGTFLELTLDHDPNTTTLVATGVFHAPLVAALLRDVIEVVRGAVRDPDVPLSLMHRSGDGASVASGHYAGGKARTGFGVDGFAIDPARIEAALRELNGVDDVVVEARDDGSGRQRLVARIAGTHPPCLEEMRVHLWRRLPGYPWPARADVVASPRGDGRGDEPTTMQGDAQESAAPVDSRMGVDGERCRALQAMLLALWRDAAGQQDVPSSGNYWQIFSFLDALSEARGLGISVDAGAVTRNRTLDSLAVDVVVRDGR